MKDIGRWLGVSSLLGLAAMISSACGSSDGGGGKSYCETWQGRQRTCGVLSEGKTGCADFYDAAEPCEISCLEMATCVDIVGYACGTGTQVLGKCMESCIGLAPVVCGDGSKLSGAARCTGFEDCADGSDEVGCDASNTGFKCRNVNQFVASEKSCDGTKDCSDGSDENAECAGRICKVGGVDTQVALSSICNGFADCDDSSDEPADCAVHSCPK